MKSFLKIFGILVIIAIGVLIVYYIFKSPKTANAPAGEAPAAQTASPSQSSGNSGTMSGEQTFSDATSGISYSYPSDMTASSGATGSTGVFISQVNLAASFEPKTNFQGATFSVSESADPTSVSNCLLPQNGETSSRTVLINGVTFSKFTFDDGGAGNFYDTTSYRTVHDSECFALEYAIHTTDLGAYDPSQGISAYDPAPIVSKLEAIVQNFVFTK